MREGKKEGEPQWPQQQQKQLAPRESLQQLLQHRFMDKFTSTPIAMEEESSSKNADKVSRLSNAPQMPSIERQNTDTDGSILTDSERHYLTTLLENGDETAIRLAHDRLHDATLFYPPPPPLLLDNTSIVDENQMAGAHASPVSSSRRRAAATAPTPTTPTLPTTTTSPRPVAHAVRRTGHVQQQLFRLHEQTASRPSMLLRRMSYRQSLLAAAASSSSLDQHFASTYMMPMFDGEGAVTATDSWDVRRYEQQNADTTDATNTIADDENVSKVAAADDNEAATTNCETSQSRHERYVQQQGNWNPFEDVSSWLDGSQGVEVDDLGAPLSDKPQNYSVTPAFYILGTNAADLTCHPHVLSPPLMESLLEFVPESLQRHNFWLKYSLRRDGAGLHTLLRQSRASVHTILALETTDGHVLGAYCAQSWRYSQGWYNNNKTIQPASSFLWQMKKSRLETTSSIVAQACQEGEIQVFHVRPGNVAVQSCAADGLRLGQGELTGMQHVSGRHYQYGLHIDASLRRGSTSNCETFGSPCLVDAAQRGAKFDISNLEVWTLTPHDKVAAAEESELSVLFLEGGRERSTTNLKLLDILVGGPI